MRLGRYELREELGAGGMSLVFRADDTKLRREVAVKVLHRHLARDADLVRRFSREARAAAALDHPAILKVFDVGEPDGELPGYIVMELVRGRTLKEHLEARGGPLLAEAALLVGAVLAEALAVAHAAGVIHRDLKPANVMVTEGGRLVLCDFGMARVAGDESTITATGAMLGTPSFMSPEQALGQELDARSDLYSLGATLYQLASGELPVTGPAPVVVAKVVQGNITPPLRRNPAMGPEVARLIERLMGKEPAARPATATEAREMMVGVLRGVGVEDAAAEVEEYLREPAAWEAAWRPRVVAATLAAARAEVVARRVPRAAALVDRVMALEPGNVEAEAIAAGLGSRGAGGKAWVGVVAAVIAVAGLTVAGWMAGRGGSEESPSEAHATSPPTHAEAGGRDVVAAAEPPDAAPASATHDTDPPTPAEAGDREEVAGKPVRRPRRDRAAATAAPPDATPIVAVEPTPPPAPAIVAPKPALRPGTLVVRLRPWCDLSIDGEPRGRSPLPQPLTLPAGKHRILCVQSTAGGARFERTIDVPPGERVLLDASLLAPVRVQLQLTSGDSARIDGTPQRNGARLTLEPGRHRVELLRGDRVTARGYIQVSTRDCILRDQPELGCY